MPKRSQLVCQHLENISRETLEEYQDIIKQYVRRRQGVYALYRRGKLYYVGLAGNLRGRLTQHLRDRHHDSWDSFSVYITIGDSHLRELESLILRIVKPSGNEQKGKFANSEDLRRRFRRDYMTEMRSKLDGLLGKVRIPSGQKPLRDPEEGRIPVLAAYIRGPIALRGRYKDKVLRAHVRKDGVIVFKKEKFTSPSVAAARAVGRKTCNGWGFWKYERAPGDWVKLDTLRG